MILHYMLSAIALHDHYMFFTWNLHNITWSFNLLHVLHCISRMNIFYIVYMHYQHILHDYYMYYMIITWIFHISFWLQKDDTSLFCSQPAWSIFTRTLALGHLHGWLLHFILYWELNQRGMTEGGIPILWGTLSWWWNATIACMRGAMLRHP